MDPTPIGSFDESSLRSRRRSIYVGAILLAMGLGLRWGESRKSLWLDEFHSLVHSRQPTIRGVLESLRPDFHAPAFFLALQPFPTSDPHALRIFPILTGLATLIPLLAIARSIRLGRTARTVVAGSYLLLPFQTLYGAELRPYAWLQFFSVVLVWAAVTPTAAKGRRFLLVVFATALGLYGHYLVTVSAAAAGAGAIFAGSNDRIGGARFLAAISLGAVLFLPWLVYDENWIFTKPTVALGTDAQRAAEPATKVRMSLDDVAAAIPRMLIPSTGLLRGRATVATRAALVALMAVTGTLLVARLLRMRNLISRESGARTALAALGAAAVGFLLLSLASVLVWMRVAIQYFNVCAWGWPLALGLLASTVTRPRLRRVVATVILAACCVGGVAQSLGAPREDYPRAVRAALEAADALRASGVGEPILSTALWQPAYFANIVPFQVYAPTVEAIEPSEIGARDTRSAVVLLTRKVPWPFPNEHRRFLDERLRGVTNGRRHRSTTAFPDGLAVHVFVPE